MIRYGSVCSGIEAATCAWHPLGWEPAWFSEIEPYPCALLDHYYDAPNLGNMETLLDDGRLTDVDVLVGGTPCQSFSVAGLRKGLDDDRGNLALVFCRLAAELRPRWIVWENVPGALSIDDGRAFGSILGALHECGYGLAWRVLNAQYFGVPQRRRRVFLVGYLGDWRRAGAVLFEPDCLRGNSSARPGRQDTAGTLTASAAKRRGSGEQPEGLIAEDVAGALTSNSGGRRNTYDDTHIIPDVAAPLTAGGSFNSNAPGRRREDDTNLVMVNAEGGEGALTASNLAKTVNNQTPLVFKPSHYTRDKDGAPSAIVPPLTAEQDRGDNDPLVFQQNQREEVVAKEVAGSLGAIRRGDAKNENLIAFNLAPAFGSETDLRATPTDQSASLSTQNASGANDRGTRILHAALDTSAASMNRSTYADAAETDTIEALQALLQADAEKAFCQWCLGIFTAFWPKEVLRQDLYVGGIRREAVAKYRLVHHTLSRQKTSAAWTMQDVWGTGCVGRAPQGWRSHEQQAEKFGAYLSELPYTRSPGWTFLYDLWRASQGARLLRQTLSALEKARRPDDSEGQPAHTKTSIRRLTVNECEALQGFPRGYTLIDFKGKPASDTQRYRALGNSMAVPVMAWIGRRIAFVDSI